MIQNNHQLLEKAIILATKELALFQLQKGNNDDKTMVISSLFRQIIEMAIGVKVSAEAGLMTPSEINYRGFLESYIAFKYILIDPFKSNQRAIAYKVGYHIHQIEAGQQLIDLGKFMRGNKKYYEQVIQSHKDIINKPEYKEILDEFNNLKKKYYPAWYSLFSGAKSLKELVTIVENSNLVYGIYGALSKSAHSYTALRALSLSGILPPQAIFNPNEEKYNLNMIATSLTTTILSFTDNIFPEFVSENEFKIYSIEYLEFKKRIK